MTKAEKLRTKLEHLYMFYEIFIPIVNARSYGEEYYWHARYVPVLVAFKKGKTK